MTPEPSYVHIHDADDNISNYKRYPNRLQSMPLTVVTGLVFGIPFGEIQVLFTSSFKVP